LYQGQAVIAVIVGAASFFRKTQRNCPRSHHNTLHRYDSDTGAHTNMETLKSLWRDEQGQDLVEYALVAALIALASVAALNNVAGLLTTAFTNAVTNMSSNST
jgi:pilus assembly protein Flp/PilA